MKDKAKSKEISVKHSILIIGILGIICYSNALFNGFVGDDTLLIQNNPLIKSVSNIPKLFSSGTFFDVHGSANYYKPVELVFYTLIYHVFGLHAFPYHLIQILFHLANAIFLFLILGKIFKRDVSLLLSLLFLVHPGNTETVIYIANLQDILFMFFGLLAMLATYTKFKFPYKHILVCAMLLLSVLSKETGALFILILPIYNLLFQEKDYKYLGSSALAFSVYLFLRLQVAKIFFSKALVIVPIMTLPFMERIINTPKVILFYLKLFFFPKDLLSFQAWIVKTTNFKDFYLPLILDSTVLIIFIFLSVWAYKKDRKVFKVLIFFFIWLTLGLGMHSQLLPLDQTVADRWFYFPIIGLIGIVGSLFELFQVNLKSNWVRISIASVLIVLSARTIIRNNNWRNSLTLYTHDIQHNQDSAQLEAGLAFEMLKLKNIDEAQLHLNRAVEIFPNVNSWASMATFYIYTNRYDKAKESYYNALKYGDTPQLYSSLGLLIMNTEPLAKSESFLQEALSKFPNDPELLKYQAVTKYRMGKKDEAINLVRKAYSISKDLNLLFFIKSMEENKQVQIQSY